MTLLKRLLLRTNTLTDKQRDFLSKVSDEILLEEIRRRANWHGTVSIDVTTTINETF